MKPAIIQGGIYEDHRGRVGFINEFDLAPIRRMYYLLHNDTETVRGWQGHRVEQKWFVCLRGKFTIHCVHMEEQFAMAPFFLNGDSPCTLHVPNGFATAIRASVPDSLLLVF